MKYICLNTKEIFEDEKTAAEYAGIKTKHSIKDAAIYKFNAGVNKETGERLQWRFLEEYDENEIVTFKKIPLKTEKKVEGRKFICLNTLEVFDDNKKAIEYAGEKCAAAKFYYAIRKRITFGKHPETGQALQWRFYEDFDKKENFAPLQWLPTYQIRCVNTNKVFDEVEQAAEYAGLKTPYAIVEAYRGNKVAGRVPGTDEKAKWELLINR